MTGLKLVIDTNVFITIIGRHSPYRWIFDRILSGEFILCISNEILLEYNEILERKTSVEVAENITQLLSIYPYVQHIAIYYKWNLMANDPDDNKYIDCAVSANAFCIVSNDNHFDILKGIEFPQVDIYRLNEFEHLIK